MEIGKEIKTQAEWSKFAKLIVAITKAGLNLSGCAKAGINRRSGNTYIWSEDWIGSAFIGLGDQKVFWCWSCPYCGDEVIFSSHKQILAFQKRQNKFNDQKCPDCRRKK